MSRDLQILNGDVVLNGAGDLVLIEKHEKLAQDALKIIFTEQSSNKYHPEYGSLLGEINIGQPQSRQWIEGNLIEASIQNALIQLGKYQAEQITFQDTTPEELLFSVERVAIEPDAVEPRQFNIAVTISSQALQTVEVSFVWSR